MATAAAAAHVLWRDYPRESIKTYPLCLLVALRTHDSRVSCAEYRPRNTIGVACHAAHRKFAEAQRVVVALVLRHVGRDGITVEAFPAVPARDDPTVAVAHVVR